MAGGRGNTTLIILWKASTNEWRIRGEGEGDIYRRPENSDREKKRGRKGERKGEERADAFSPENMSYLRDKGWGEELRGQAGQREERRAFFSRQQNFLQQPMATSQALFFWFGFRKSWRVAWSTSFRCRLWREEDEEKVRITIITVFLLQCANATVTTNPMTNILINEWDIHYSIFTFQGRNYLTCQSTDVTDN